MIATAIGGTGLTGSLVVRKLVDDPAITKVISIARRSLEIPNPKLEEVLIHDLGELPALGSMLRGDFYFCCLGTTIEIAGSKEGFEKVDHDAVEAFAKIAKTQCEIVHTHFCHASECELDVFLQSGKGTD